MVLIRSYMIVCVVYTFLFIVAECVFMCSISFKEGIVKGMYMAFYVFYKLFVSPPPSTPPLH